MPTLLRLGFLLSCCALLAGRPAAAQTAADPSSGAPPPPHLAVVDGHAFIDREDRSEEAVANVPVLEGDRLRTESGRLEAVFPDGSLLHLDRASAMDVLAGDLVRLLRGRVAMIVRGTRSPEQSLTYQIDTAVASVQTRGPGEFRVSSVRGGQGTEVELAVFRGEAVLANDAGAEVVRAGEMALVREGLAPSRAEYFNSARWDDFDRWSAQRRDAGYGTVSADYLPQELDAYASTFDRYGVWREDAVDGRVWYPTVAQDWRPYAVGYWREYPAWDAFWVSADPWGWPTHHYGRWGYSRAYGWYWLPARAWAPSWVYWAHSPGYVSWCALGRWDNPVFGLFGLMGAIVGDWIDPWRGWTVIERRHFGSYRSMHDLAYDGRRLGRDERGRFAVQRHGPGLGQARPRGPGAGQPGGSRDVRGPERPAAPGGDRAWGAGARPGASAASRRAFPAAGLRTGAASRTETARRTPDVTAFSNRRTGAIERVAPGGSWPGTASGDTRLGSAPRATYPRSSGGTLGAGSAYPRSAPSQTPGSRFGTPRASGSTFGSAFGSAPRATYPRSSDSTFGTGSAYPRSAPSQAPGSRYGTPRASGSTFGSAPRATAPRSSGGTTFSSAPRATAPRSSGSTFGGTSRSASPRSGAGSSSSPPSAPRYNSGSGGSRQPGGGRSSAGSRGGRGRTP